MISRRRQLTFDKRPWHVGISPDRFVLVKERRSRVSRAI